jgi:hypothetical protein
MRLVHASTLKIESFSADNVPRYAILSHTWGEGEVTLDDIRGASSRHLRLQRMRGWKKIKYCCRQAVLENIGYAWIDTCCIDKSSSAELSEAINSMYNWYSNAAVCYAYLSDVAAECVNDRMVRIDATEFEASRWFTRGWTLQELIAPEQLVFYDLNWQRLGTKYTMHASITKVTGITLDILVGDVKVASTSVAQRMSWAANRKTTRIEDIAYCLLGLFNCHMPLLYGEGLSAFARLQEEIIKQSDDHSIFAWESGDPPPDVDIPGIQSNDDFDGITHATLGILALHPYYFRRSGGVVNTLGRKYWDSYAMTNRGLRMQLPIIRLGKDRYAGVLGCHYSSDDEVWEDIVSSISLPLRPTGKGDNSLGRDTLAPLHIIREVEIEYGEIQMVYLSKTSHKITAVDDRDTMKRTIDLSWPATYRGYHIRHAIYASTPLSTLTCFHSLNGPLLQVQLPLGGSDFIVAIQFASDIISRLGFTVVLESRRGCQFWRFKAVPSARNDDVEGILRDNVNLERDVFGKFRLDLYSDTTVFIEMPEYMTLEIEVRKLQASETSDVKIAELDAGAVSAAKAGDSKPAKRTRGPLDYSRATVIPGLFELEA